MSGPCLCLVCVGRGASGECCVGVNKRDVGSCRDVFFCYRKKLYPSETQHCSSRKDTVHEPSPAWTLEA